MTFEDFTQYFCEKYKIPNKFSVRYDNFEKYNTYSSSPNNYTKEQYFYNNIPVMDSEKLYPKFDNVRYYKIISCLRQSNIINILCKLTKL